MTNAMLYQSRAKSRFTAVLVAAVALHVAAFSFAIGRPQPASGFIDSAEPAEIFFEPSEPVSDPPAESSDPLPTPPPTEQSFPEPVSTPAPVRQQVRPLTPIVRPRNSTFPGSMNLSRAKVFAVSAPRPEYPYEARRQKLTGHGVVSMKIDPSTGNVTSVSMSKTTDSPFLDNAAIAGFKRWRFRPGTVSTVTCPVTFTLTGASY
jgi:TonB family protein